jgi:cell division protein FtsB
MNSSDRFFFKCLIFLTASLLAWGTFHGETSFADYFFLKEKRDLYKKKIQALEAETQSIALEIERVEGSEAYAKKILKDKYHVLADGEKVLLFSE